MKAAFVFNAYVPVGTSMPAAFPCSTGLDFEHSQKHVMTRGLQGAHLSTFCQYSCPLRRSPSSLRVGLRDKRMIFSGRKGDCVRSSLYFLSNIPFKPSQREDCASYAAQDVILSVASCSSKRPAVVQRFLNSAGSVWGWILITVSILVVPVIQAVAIAATFWYDRYRVFPSRVRRCFTNICLRLNPLWRMEIVGPVPSQNDIRGSVVVCNHQSNADVFMLSRLPWDVKYLAKKVLFVLPFLGWAMRMAGDIAVDRRSIKDAKRSMVACATYLRSGVPVLIFPEGTRSDTADMLPFKDGAFRLAVETGAPIRPVVLTGSHLALPKHSMLMGCTHAKLSVGDEIATSGKTLADVPALKSETWQRMKLMLDAQSKASNHDSGST